MDFFGSIQHHDIGEYYDNLLRKMDEVESVYMYGSSTFFHNCIKWITSKGKIQILSKIRGVCDLDVRKYGTTVLGIPICSPQVLKEIVGKQGAQQLFVLITCTHADRIIPELESFGFNERNYGIFCIDRSNSLDEFSNYYHSHKNDFEMIYNILEDEKSKVCFSNLINFRLSGDLHYLREISDNIEEQYFDKELIDLDNAIYLDCGAYDGDTVKWIDRYSNGRYSKIISLEADPQIFAKLCKNASVKRDVYCLNKAVWSEESELSFSSIPDALGNYVTADGNIVVKADKIDSIVGLEKISHIKMDIEGAEIPALLGAFNTIEKNHPVLAICVYHRVDDYIRIPLLIKAMNPGYRLYFRHYKVSDAWETVCYAIMKQEE